MESGSEQYFDSVEEFSDFTKSESVASLSTEKPFDEDEITEDDIIPYYDKATSKSEMELNKGLTALKRKKKEAPKRYTSQNYSPQCRLKSKSYLHMFQTKFGLDISKVQNDFPSFSSSTSSSFLAFNDNVDSIYIKSGYADSSSSHNSSRTRDLALSLTNLDTYKDTEFETETIQSRCKCVSNNKRSSRTITTNVPVLGKLGPVIPTDKLELLKKRQQYGIKASLANRIRMVEIKALRDLENEIEESKIVCK
nr:unnamed protein product [Callosobruchus chinensis]